MAARKLSELSNLKNLLHGYRIRKVTPVPEFQLTAVDLIHEKSQARHLHLARDDPNKAFSIQFRTTPRDNSGVAHILEHTALCGSQKFPVRDPFFKMLNRSMATFMNAFTASDWTMYPFSTMNDKDFLNLLNIYMDASLRPNLKKSDFLQEGWRLEPADLDKPDSPLQFKGIVYNEMKGVFSSANNLFAQAVENHLLPVNYGVVSGGHPANIPELTWQQLKQFHQQYYHPSNSRMYSYGDMDLVELLQYLDHHYLQHYTALDLDSSVKLEPKWNQSKVVEISCPIDPMAADPSRQCVVTVSYLLDDIRDSYNCFVLGFLSQLLLNGESSPFYQHLLESGVGLDWAGFVHGYDSSSRTTHFSVGLQGVRPEDVQKVPNLIQQIFQQVVKEGFPQKRIDAILHQIELSLKHDASNFGLKLILALSSPLNHEVLPEEVLLVNSKLDRLRNDLENPEFLIHLIEEKFLKNTHQLTAIMKPKDTYVQDEISEESTRLNKKVASLTEKDRAEIIRNAQELREKQNKKENLDCLPCLVQEDIKKEARQEIYSLENVLGCSVQVNEAPTNDIVYFRMSLRMDDLPHHLLPFFPLFSSVFTQMGAGDLTYREFSQEVDLCSGGFGSSPGLVRAPHHNAPRALHSLNLHLSSHALMRNCDRMFALWTKLLTAPQLQDADRLAHLIQQEVSGSWSSHVISQSGHAFAMRRSSAMLDEVCHLSELWSGLLQAAFMKDLAQKLNESKATTLENIISKLTEIYQHVVAKERLKIAINAQSDQVSPVLEQITNFLQRFPSGKALQEEGQIKFPLTSLASSCYYEMPFNVNYCAKSYALPSYTHPQYAIYQVMSRLISVKHLHGEIREKGGAYGGGAKAKPGSLQFYSYRDPQSFKTLDTFDESLKWLADSSRSGDVTEQELFEAKLNIFQQLDAPVSAGGRGMSFFLNDIDNAMRQHHRDTLFGVTLDSVRQAAVYLLTKPAGTTIIGPALNSSTQENISEWQYCRLD